MDKHMIRIVIQPKSEDRLPSEPGPSLPKPKYDKTILKSILKYPKQLKLEVSY